MRGGGGTKVEGLVGGGGGGEWVIYKFIAEYKGKIGEPEC